MTGPELSLTRTREFHPTDLADEILLVVPDAMQRHAAVARVVEAVGEAGRPPETISQSRFRQALFREKHVIAFGNLANNRAIQRLYTARCCFVDTFFPGATRLSGQVDLGSVRIRPELHCRGRQHGRRAGGRSERLHGHRRRQQRPVEARPRRVFRPRSSPHLPDDSEMERMVRDDLKIWGTGWSASPFRGGGLLSYLWQHYLTDHPAWARAAAEILKGSIEPWRAECRAHPEAYHCFFNLHLYIHLWDLVEDNPLFSPEDRHGAVTMFGELLRHLMKLSYVSEEVNPPGEIRQNHTTFIGLNLAVGGDYMTRRHGYSGVSTGE